MNSQNIRQKRNDQKEFFVGLDIGTNSVGYVVTDLEYNIPKFHGEPAWGVALFDEASLKDERRRFRTARRRLDRRQQRVSLIQELFAKEIAKNDPDFFKRLQASILFREDAGVPYTLFNDANFTDKQYYRKYPTIHHLIKELMTSSEPHDARLVYLAISWLCAHRGHFLSHIDKNNIAGLKDFHSVYSDFIDFFETNALAAPWSSSVDVDRFGTVLKQKARILEKTKTLIDVLYSGHKPGQEEEYPYRRDLIVKLLAGGTCKLSELFEKEEYAEYGSISLGMDEDKMGEIMSNIGEDYELLRVLRLLYDWSILVDVLGGFDSISEAKVADYEQHRRDLKALKRIIRKYLPNKYNEVFRELGKDNYPAYVYHTDEKDSEKLKKKDIEAFSKYLKGILDQITLEDADADEIEKIKYRIDLRTFLPKQKTTNNRVIPFQLYWAELNQILKNAESYLPFLREAKDGMTISDKIRAVFEFRIPYFVGPLNEASEYSWLVRKADKIYPWNFEQVVDLDASEEAFIQRLTNTCTYIPGEPVLPKDSLCYHKFMVLNEINNIRINGERLPVDVKQKIYNNVFLSNRKVTRKKLESFLQEEGVLDANNPEALSGIDTQIHSDLIPQISFRRLLSNQVVTEEEVERIIERASYSEDKRRLRLWIAKKLPKVGEEDVKYICSLRMHDFGRLSRAFLCKLEGVDPTTGELCSILSALWNSSYNIMELLSSGNEYGFYAALQEKREAYYEGKKLSLDARLDEMYISNAVKRPIYRTFAIMKDIEKAFGIPKRIFVETTRGGSEEQKGKRTKSRKQQILELYAQCEDEDVRILEKQLEEMGEAADNRLQGDKLFLYYMQLGKCMYSGTPIVLEDLGSKKYDIDHIYPQAFVKDDSILNNKVLVLSEENGNKGDQYPISDEIRHKMDGYWTDLKNAQLITEEKYKRLKRATPFTEEERYGFINRQITETSQSTKAVAELLQERYPNTEIVYSKASLISDFRQEYDLLKSRVFNDLHHAVDAYLNVVVGNVYHMRFSRKWFNVNSNYSVKTKTIFSAPLSVNGEQVWCGEHSLQKVKKNAVKNTAHFTKYAYFKTGGLFNQQLVGPAEKLTPIKKGLPTEKYGGYDAAGIMFYIPTRYQAGKKQESFILSVELLEGRRFLQDEVFAREYAIKRLEKILGKKVDEVAFPMGMRPWKVNTMLSLDGFRVIVTGTKNKGKCLRLQSVMQFSASYDWQYYLKKLEMYSIKIKVNQNHVYSEDYDRIDPEKNLQLYDYYLEKMEQSIYKKRPNMPIETVKQGRGLFIQLGINQQVETLLNLHQLFGRMAGGCNLQTIGGSKEAAETSSFSTTPSNWAKSYQDVRIIDSSPSGLWEKESENLLDIL